MTENSSLKKTVRKTVTEVGDNWNEVPWTDLNSGRLSLYILPWEMTARGPNDHLTHGFTPEKCIENTFRHSKIFNSHNTMYQATQVPFPTAHAIVNGHLNINPQCAPLCACTAL